MSLARHALHLLCAPLLTAVPGAPESPVADAPARLSMTWHNDVFGAEIGDNPDDYRTNGFSVLWLPDQTWALAVNYSNLTNRGGAGITPARTDELTATISRVAINRHTEVGRCWLALGLGFRASGDLGGADLQNAWHDVFAFEDLALPYESTTTRPVATAGWHFDADLGPPPIGADLALIRGSHLRVATTGSTIISNREFQFDTTTRLILASSDSRLWAGLRLALRDGATQNATSRLIADIEDGAWLTMGGVVGNFYAEASYNLASDLSQGWVGWRVDYEREPHWFGGDRLIAEVGPVLGDFAVDVGVRWQSDGLSQGGWLRRRLQWIVGYGWGHVPGFDFGEDASIRFQQLTAGLDFSFFDVVAEPTDRPVTWTPFALLAAGYRQEEVTPMPPIPTLFEREEEAAPLIEAGIGARVLFGPTPAEDGIRYGVALSWRHRFILGDTAVAVDRNGTAWTYLEDNGDVHLRLLVEVGW